MKVSASIAQGAETTFSSPFHAPGKVAQTGLPSPRDATARLEGDPDSPHLGVFLSRSVSIFI